jgi:hypothetical protein
MVFNVNVVNHVQAAISVSIADAGQGVDNAPVSYDQVRQSFGIANYDVKEFFLYATDYAQLTGVINYNQFTSDGNSRSVNVVNAIDPYQNTTTLKVDLSKLPIPIILDGFSNFSSNILPNSSLQINLKTERITNSYGFNLTNFQTINELTGNTFFGEDEFSHSIENILATNRQILEDNYEEENIKNFDGGGVNPNTKYRIGAELDYGAILIAIGVGYATYYFYKKYYKL